MEFITEIETSIGQVAQKNFMDMQQGDVESTYADTTGLMDDFNYSPSTSLDVGVINFVKWYKEFYR
jgi:UDP-glucuronate 4-epimerase